MYRSRNRNYQIQMYATSEKTYTRIHFPCQSQEFESEDLHLFLQELVEPL